MRVFLPALPGHAVADHAGPVELIGLARLQALAAHHHRLPDAGECGRRHECARRRQLRTLLCACCSGASGSTGAPAVILNAIAQRGRSGAGFCCRLRYGKVSSPCSTSSIWTPDRRSPES